MAQSQELTLLLKTFVDHVYFQPPANVQLEYPCIIFKRSRAYSRFANNKLYHDKKQYELTVIDRNPDSDIPDKVKMLPLCSHSRFYVVDNLNHDIFSLYF